jgi:hypothetical protein
MCGRGQGNMLRCAWEGLFVQALACTFAGAGRAAISDAEGDCQGFQDVSALQQHRPCCVHARTWTDQLPLLLLLHMKHYMASTAAARHHRSRT